MTAVCRVSTQYKEAEAKEELKRRAKQLEMQRREQQRRTAAGGSSGAGYLGVGGGVSGYSPVPQRFDAPTPVRTASPIPTASRAPQFKGSGMKLGTKKTTQSALLDALGGEALLSEDMSVPATPTTTTPEPSMIHKHEHSSLPEVIQERYVANICVLLSTAKGQYSVHIIIRENIRLELQREGGLNDLELKGDMNLNISDASLARIKLAIADPAVAFGPELQYKQHPNVGKFAANKERVIALKDPSRSFPVGQSLAVLKWRYAGKDESYVPLSSAYNDLYCFLPLISACSQLLAYTVERRNLRRQH